MSETGEDVKPQVGTLRDNVERATEESAPPRAGAWPSPRIVYSSHYTPGGGAMGAVLPWLVRREGEKVGRVWRGLRNKFRGKVDGYWIDPKRPVSDDELERVHTKEYLKRLRSSAFVAEIMEAPRLRLLPHGLVDRLLLRPMRYAAMGTVLAAEAALEHGIAVNLAGGYHLASPADGYGLSAYADVPLAIAELRRTEKLGKRDCVAYIDVNPRQGLGVSRSFLDDRRVFIYDQYHAGTFPRDILAQERVDCDVPMKSGCTDKEYIEELQWRLPRFLDAVTIGGNLKLAIYHLALEINEGGPVHGLQLTERGLLARDKFVLKELTERHIPTAVLFGGHCGVEGAKVAVDRAALILKKWGGLVER